MNHTVLAFPLATVIALGLAGTASAQPQTELIAPLDKQLVQAVWCSALLFEESFHHDSLSDESARYETMAYDLGDQIDELLLGERGFRQVEVDELWSVFDGAAFDLAEADTDSFVAQLDVCELSFDQLL